MEDTDIDINDTDALQMPLHDRMDVEYKLYVNNLPSELNENAIEEIFGQYGEVTGRFHPRNATWAYITYGSYREAEYAIRELHDKKPLYLKVKLSNDRSAKEEVHKSRVQKVSISEDPYSTADSMEAPSDATAKPAASKINQVLKMMHKHHVSRQHEDRIPSLREEYNAYESEERYGNTSRLWSRDLMANAAETKRRISLGRGYMTYEIPEYSREIEEYIKKVYDQRYGLYEHMDDKLASAIKKCFVCSLKTMKHCEKCDTYYCSKVCQIKDWPRHQIECERIPALVEKVVNNVASLGIREQNKYDNQGTEAADVKLRRPRAPMQAETSNSSTASANKNTITNDHSIDETMNQHKRLSDRYENIAKQSETKKSVAPATDANKKGVAERNQSLPFDQTNRDTDQPRKSPRNAATFNACKSNRNHVTGENKAGPKSSPNDERLSNTSDGKAYATDSSFSKTESQNGRKKPYNDRENKDYKQKNSSFKHEDTPSDDLGFQKDTYLSKTKFTEVEIVVPMESCEYWVYKTEDSDARITLMTDLQHVAEKSRNVKPIVGNIYGVRYETIWHRAMVISLNPLKVHFIDFGNDEILEKDDDIKDIENMWKPSKFARKIRLAQPVSDKHKNLQYGDKISVKMLSMNPDKTIIVEIEGQSRDSPASAKTESVVYSGDASSSHTAEKIPQENEQSKSGPTIQPINILTALHKMAETAQSNMELMGLLQIYGPVQSPSNMYSASLCPYLFTEKLKDLLKGLQMECAKVEDKYDDFVPQVGSIVCGKTESGWNRGYVSVSLTSSTDLRIVAIDEAKILTVEKIIPCPVKFQNICSFAVTCEVMQSNVKLETSHTYKFSTVIKEENITDKNLKIALTVKKDPKTSETITALIKAWNPSTKSQVPALSELKNGSQICLTSYRNHYFMFGRSLDKEDVEYYHRIMQQVAQAARTAPYLSESRTIEKSQMVIAPFLDGNNYRAMVTNVQDSKAKVIYVDFGNLSEVNVNELQVLPDNLRLERSSVAKIYLKDVPRDIPMTKDVDTYLRQLVGSEVALTCTHDGAPLKDGINLATPTGESVNKKINELLEPKWMNNDADAVRCYMLEDMQIAPLGKVGETVKALVLFMQEDSQKYLMLAPIDIDLLTHITEVMPSQIHEYCESTEYYIPRAKELCLALYDGAWYRAACFDPESTNGVAQIFFVDYGNVEAVEHKDIRLMPKDFIEPASMASMCTVANLAPVDSDGNYSPAVQKVLADLKPMESIVTIKIVACPENGDYTIELPEIHANLVEQRIISP